MLKFVSVVLAAFVVAGCGSVPMKSANTTDKNIESVTTSVKCTSYGQADCLKFELLTYIYKSEHPLMKGLPELAAAHGPVNELKFLEARKKGQLQGAHGKFRAYFWKLNGASAQGAQVYRLNGNDKYKSVPFKDVTKSASYPKTDLGAPSLVLEIETAGDDPMGVIFQIPWKWIDPKETTALFCDQDETGVYPIGKVNESGTHQGHWLTKSAFKRFADKEGGPSRLVLLAFVKNVKAE